MTDAEQVLLVSFLRQASRYVEFGCGGSTVLAARYVKTSIISVESDTAWIAKVEDHLATIQGEAQINVTFANIGKTGKLGYPVEETSRHLWPTYYESVWQHQMAREADLVLVDGRFRVASFLSTMLNCGDDAIVLIHDFKGRAEYHAIYKFAREIASVDELSAFMRATSFEPDAARLRLEQFAYDPR